MEDNINKQGQEGFNELEEEKVVNKENEGKENDIEKELREEKDRYIRLYAEFDNFKKRNIKERQDLLKYGGGKVMESLLPVVDDFRRAMKELAKQEENKEVLEGIQLIFNKFNSALEANGLKNIEVNIGDDFDVDTQEAVSQIEVLDMKNKIVEVIEVGYMLYDKVIRYTKVIVGK